MINTGLSPNMIFFQFTISVKNKLVTEQYKRNHHLRYFLIKQIIIN